MIRTIYQQVIDIFAVQQESVQSAGERKKALRLATAVLLIDVARADHVFGEEEFDNVLRLVESQFGLSPEDAAALVNEASEVAEEIVSVYEFTQQLHRHLDDAEKARIIAMLWQIAYADGRLDKFENSLILKISDLLYVNRARVMRLKHDAAGQGD